MNHVFVAQEKNINIVVGPYNIKNNDTRIKIDIRKIKSLALFDLII